MKKVALIGSGDLARLAIHYINENGNHNVFGIYDDFSNTKNTVSGINIIGPLDQVYVDYQNKLFDLLFIAVGYSRMDYRARTFDRFKGKIPFVNIVHKSCIIDSTAKLGEGVFLFPGVILDHNVEIKNNVLVNLGVTIAHDSTIGEHSFLAPNVSVAGFVFINKLTFLGINSTIIDNITLCSNVLVASGAVVVKNIETEGSYAGVPAKKLNKNE